uniref:Uncharacterized protein n=1 Tax=Oryza meridionalis TaxID=40149 RepID=A0A0E0F5E6_9ORYZ
MPVLEGHAVVPHVHRLCTWLSAASGCGLLRDATVGCVVQLRGCHAADERAGAAIHMNISCCSYSTGEDSTITCTMTQFEDRFSTIKPDGIQVRCHKCPMGVYLSLY